MDSMDTVEFVLATQHDGVEFSERDPAHLCCDPTKGPWLPPDPHALFASRRTLAYG